jgi:hypothetical protein
MDGPEGLTTLLAVRFQQPEPPGSGRRSSDHSTFYLSAVVKTYGLGPKSPVPAMPT